MTNLDRLVSYSETGELLQQPGVLAVENDTL